jgi:hypothetical protein
MIFIVSTTKVSSGRKPSVGVIYRIVIQKYQKLNSELNKLNSVSLTSHSLWGRLLTPFNGKRLVLNPFYRRESLAKKPYSAILNLFKPLKTHLNAFRSRPDSRLKMLSVTYEVTLRFICESDVNALVMCF